MNYFEEQFLDFAKGLIESKSVVVSPDSNAFFQKVTAYFPIIHSQIDWQKVQGRTAVSKAEEDPQRAFLKFFRKVSNAESLSGLVSYAGDGVTDFSITSELDILSRLIPALISIPQHHFFLGESHKRVWCFNLTFEGGMMFGFGRTGSDGLR